MRHRQAIALLALVGFGVALYLWLYKIGVIGTLQCGSEACEYVQTSRWSVFLGLPVALYGVLGYVALLATALTGLQPRYVGRPGPTRVLAALSLVGFGFSVYLTVLELFVIHAICRWCVASALIMTAIAAVAVGAAVRRS